MGEAEKDGDILQEHSELIEQRKLLEKVFPGLRNISDSWTLDLSGTLPDWTLKLIIQSDGWKVNEANILQTKILALLVQWKRQELTEEEAAKLKEILSPLDDKNKDFLSVLFSIYGIDTNKITVIWPDGNRTELSKTLLKGQTRQALEDLNESVN